MRWFRRGPRERRYYIYVQFEPAGKVYTYNRTLSDFADLMSARYRHTGDVPYRAWTEDDEITFDVDDDSGD